MMSRFFLHLPTLIILTVIGLRPIQADLVAHYSFDEISPNESTVVDSLGRNNGAFINGSDVLRGVSSPDALLGTACEFTLQSGVNLGTGSAVRPVDQFTISWWMRPDTLDSFDRIYETMSGTSN